MTLGLIGNSNTSSNRATVREGQVVIARMRSGWGFKVELTRISSRGPEETTRPAQCAYVNKHARQKSTPPNPCFPRLNRSLFFSGFVPKRSHIPTQPSCQLTLSLSTPKIRSPAIPQNTTIHYSDSISIALIHLRPSEPSSTWLESGVSKSHPRVGHNSLGCQSAWSLLVTPTALHETRPLEVESKQA